MIKKKTDFTVANDETIEKLMSKECMPISRKQQFEI